MALWVVRAGRQGEHEEFCLSNNAAAIGWDRLPDLSKFDSQEKLRALYEDIYTDRTKAHVSNALGQLWNFLGRMNENDLVVFPLKTRSAIAVGRVEGPYKHCSNNPDGAKHTRKVKWIRTDLPRNAFGQDLLASFGAFRTVSQVQCSEAEMRVQAILKCGADPQLGEEGEKKTSGPSDAPEIDIEQHALDQIRAFITAKFHGHEFTRLVAEVLRAQGYSTYVAMPGPDGGVDILAGRGPMGFDAPRLCVQVKSGRDPENVNTLRELQGVMKNFGAQQGLLVSWGGFKDTVYKEARTLFFDLRLWDADRFIQALLDSYDQLSDEIQAELPLKKVWALVPEEQGS